MKIVQFRTIIRNISFQYVQIKYSVSDGINCFIWQSTLNIAAIMSDRSSTSSTQQSARRLPFFLLNFACWLRTSLICKIRLYWYLVYLFLTVSTRAASEMTFNYGTHIESPSLSHWAPTDSISKQKQTSTMTIYGCLGHVSVIHDKII